MQEIFGWREVSADFPNQKSNNSSLYIFGGTFYIDEYRFVSFPTNQKIKVIEPPGLLYGIAPDELNSLLLGFTFP
jgi:hypothetical protein